MLLCRLHSRVPEGSLVLRFKGHCRRFERYHYQYFYPSRSQELFIQNTLYVLQNLTLVDFYQITRCLNTTNQSPYAQRHENFVTKQNWHRLWWSFGKWNIIHGKDHDTPQCNQSTYVDDQPISGFSHRSLVSNSISQRWVLSVPDCMAFLHGL